MNSLFRTLAVGAGLGAGMGLWLAAMPAAAQEAARITVMKTNYHGWAGSLRLSNGKAEVIVVPAIGRVMQFGFAGEEGVFWENRALDGQPAAWTDRGWINFGGDKTWPSPEADWGQFTSRKEWQPPPAFDGSAHEAQVLPDGDVMLTSPVDRFFGIRIERRIHLDAAKPVLTITTAYQRVRGEPAKIGVWVITQLKEPAGLFIPLAKPSRFAEGWTALTKEPPPTLQVKDGLLSLRRSPQPGHKIGTDAGVLLWVGERHACRIDSPRVPDAEYPDQGSSAEIWTNPDPLPYIELETLGPLHLMKPGDRIERVNTYTLFRRTEASAEAEARRILTR